MWSLPSWLAAVAVVIIVHAAVFAVAAAVRLGPGLTASPLPSAAAQLRTTGVYGCVRHPIYTGMIAAIIAVAVVQGRDLAFVGAAIFLLGFCLKARVEERFLEAALPDYGDYRKLVRMLVPFVI